MPRRSTDVFGQLVSAWLAGPQRARQAQTPKYAPLLTNFVARPPTEQTVTVSFATIEALVVAPLPADAWTTDFWTGRHNAPRLWQQLGWRFHLNRHERAIVFTRSQP